jgi:hypothetical protein
MHFMDWAKGTWRKWWIIDICSRGHRWQRMMMTSHDRAFHMLLCHGHVLMVLLVLCLFQATANASPGASFGLGGRSILGMKKVADLLAGLFSS